MKHGELARMDPDHSPKESKLSAVHATWLQAPEPYCVPDTGVETNDPSQPGSQGTTRKTHSITFDAEFLHYIL